MKLDGKINTINRAVVCYGAKGAICFGTKGSTTIGTRGLISSDFSNRILIIAHKIFKIALVLVLFFFKPLIINAQIESPKLNYIFDNYFGNETFGYNELEYFGLDCDFKTKFPKQKKGKLFCQSSCSSETHINRTYIVNSKYYFNDNKKLTCIIEFTVDSMTRDTVYKAMETYKYSNGLLTLRLRKELIRKSYYSLDDKKEKLLSDSTKYFYSHVTKNRKKGYSINSGTGAFKTIDTIEFEYEWLSNINHEYQIVQSSALKTRNGSTNKSQIVIQLNRSSFFIKGFSRSSFENSIYFSFNMNKDSFIVFRYLPDNESQVNKENHVVKNHISYTKNLKVEKSEYDSTFFSKQNRYILYTKRVDLNKNNLPVSKTESFYSEISNEFSNFILKFTYKYETRIE